MKSFDSLKSKIESIFTSLNIDYTCFNQNETDLYYVISIEALGKLKPLDSITCIIYTSNSDCTLNFLVANIYSIDESKNPLMLYEPVNEMNIHNIVGRFMVLSEKRRRQIAYISTAYCGHDFSRLNENFMEYQIKIFMSYIDELFALLKKNTGVNK